MATELQLILRFEGPPPDNADIEEEFDCVVIERDEEEV